ncbi:hypothetical protein B7G54_07015 [Burkholderia puraquae]|uniref:Lipoyl-binding domain-containing protein n=1 Tax=Burkholderia puraquae TaxID=1904757 RepID=A0A1X1PKF5_9BURK|nr:biotin/lipoyl-containing protein [Burkholderia puraquae]ORT87287.1 hypothetical protein B7G54_07015 [Burkholderia puraquae]CAB3764789.1 hypothetical protein LMG29660_05086 [Burkholderia puraquae]
MTDLQDIERLIVTLQSAGVSECVYTAGDQTIRLEFDRHTSTIANEHRESSGTEMLAAVSPLPGYVRAPCCGRFMRTHPLLDHQMADTDAVVIEGQHIAYIEVDSVLFPVVAPFHGRLGRIAVANGERIGYGAALIEIVRSTFE